MPSAPHSVLLQGMNTINHILATQQHRPWPLPEGSWRYYQEWNDALFLHWKIPDDILLPLLPPGLTPDRTDDGALWISLVAFTMQQIRPRYLPALRPVSDFHELNLRTYVRHGNKPGVCFLSIEAQKQISVFIARNLSGLPYVKSGMRRSRTAGSADFHSANKDTGFSLRANFSTGDSLSTITPLDQWLTERYCLYQDNHKRLLRFDIHHLPWPLRKVTINKLDVRYRLGAMDLYELPPDLIHYSEGVQVIAWDKNVL